jgi:hypothetical protein
MIPEIAKLLEEARGGAGDAFPRLVEHLRLTSAKEPLILLEAVLTLDETLQRAVIEAVREQTGTAVHDALRKIATEGATSARQQLVYALTDSPRWPLDDIAELLLHDPDDRVRQSATWAGQ